MPGLMRRTPRDFPGPARLRTALALAAGLGAAIAGGCTTDVGDQYCTEESVATDKDDHCPYGPPGGPKVAGGGCPPIVIDTTQCGPTWEGDIFPLFKDPTRGNCTASGCHGAEPGAKGIYMPPNDAQASYIELKGYVNTLQAPYLSDEDPTRAWLLCNLEGTNGGGSPMPPPSGLAPAELGLVQQWAACGMLPGGGSGSTSSGGAGGEGGGS